jgi:transcriptional regulator with XRE-family HTH domain
MVPRRSTPDPFAAAIGQRVRALREARGWRLEQLAWSGGRSSKGHLSDLENGRLMPTIASLRGVAHQLGVDVVDLLVDPKQSLRHQLIAASAHLPPATLQRWLDEADAAVASSTTQAGELAPVVTIWRGSRAPRLGVPYVDLVAAAGTIGAGRSVGQDADAWVKVDAASKKLPGVFAARVDGDSMVPLVPPGSVCLFRRPGPGSRRGRVFLIEHRGAGSPEDGGAYLLKLIEKDPQSDHHVVLRSLNPKRGPLRLDLRREELRVVAELVSVLGAVGTSSPPSSSSSSPSSS